LVPDLPVAGGVQHCMARAPARRTLGFQRGAVGPRGRGGRLRGGRADIQIQVPGFQRGARGDRGSGRPSHATAPPAAPPAEVGASPQWVVRVRAPLVPGSRCAGRAAPSRWAASTALEWGRRKGDRARRTAGLLLQSAHAFCCGRLVAGGAPLRGPAARSYPVVSTAARPALGRAVGRGDGHVCSRAPRSAGSGRSEGGPGGPLEALLALWGAVRAGWRGGRGPRLRCRVREGCGADAHAGGFRWTTVAGAHRLCGCRVYGSPDALSGGLPRR